MTLKQGETSFQKDPTFPSQTVKADIIAEKTTNSGVTVDGVLCKDGTITGTLTGFVIENRTDDPASPVTGQMWIRTDL